MLAVVGAYSARSGASGPMIDWLRMLYARMTYVVRAGGHVSRSFKSFLGLVIGDSAFPILWILYMADLEMSDFP